LKPIENFKDYYIDEDGNVYSTKYSKLRKLKPWVDSRGNYLMIGLSKNNYVTKKLVHRLVAEAFIPNPHGLPEVNHIDKNPKNNRVGNLEWCTRKYNLYQSYATMLPTRNFKKCYVLYNGEYIGSFHSKTEASKYISEKFGASYSSLIRHGKSQGFKIVERCNDYLQGESRVEDRLPLEVPTALTGDA